MEGRGKGLKRVLLPPKALKRKVVKKKNLLLKQFRFSCFCLFVICVSEADLLSVSLQIPAFLPAPVITPTLVLLLSFGGKLNTFPNYALRCLRCSVTSNVVFTKQAPVSPMKMTCSTNTTWHLQLWSPALDWATRAECAYLTNPRWEAKYSHSNSFLIVPLIYLVFN